jgi:hypothetical protein
MDKFLADQIEMMDNGFSQSQIRDNIYRRVFADGVPNLTINAMIDRCMELYAYVLITYGEKKDAKH